MVFTLTLVKVKLPFLEPSTRIAEVAKGLSSRQSHDAQVVGPYRVSSTSGGGT